MGVSPNLLPGDESGKGDWRAGGWGWDVSGCGFGEALPGR